MSSIWPFQLKRWIELLIIYIYSRLQLKSWTYILIIYKYIYIIVSCKVNNFIGPNFIFPQYSAFSTWKGPNRLWDTVHWCQRRSLGGGCRFPHGQTQQATLLFRQTLEVSMEADKGGKRWVDDSFESLANKEKTHLSEQSKLFSNYISSFQSAHMINNCLSI